MRVGAVGAPRHFHLLWDHDIEQLQEIFRAVLDRSEEIVRHWYRLYVLHFGDERSLSEGEFTRIFEPQLRRTKKALLDRDMDAYAGHVIRMGELLAERRVPLEEIIASLHLFEESAQIVFPKDTSTDLYTSFDKLSHVRIILLVGAYFRSHSAAAGERIAALEREAARLNHNGRTRFHGLVGGSGAMRRLYKRIEAVAARDGEVLVVGEKGTGKELVARAIHEISARAREPFVRFNCVAIPAELTESELFGYKREALNGASADFLGLFRAADRGTLFLDEVNALSSEMQDKIATALRERAVRRVGAAEKHPVDIRVIASTSRDPESSHGQVLPELLDRFRTSVIEVPTLRDRVEDIAPLVDHFISVFRERFGRSIYGISEDALSALHDFKWPGNVRQLGEVIESAFRTGRDQIIGSADISAKSDILTLDKRVSAQAGKVTAEPHLAKFEELERKFIQRALESTSGNKGQTAKLLKISPKKLQTLINKFDL